MPWLSITKISPATLPSVTPAPFHVMINPEFLTRYFACASRVTSLPSGAIKRVVLMHAVGAYNEGPGADIQRHAIVCNNARHCGAVNFQQVVNTGDAVVESRFYRLLHATRNRMMAITEMTRSIAIILAPCIEITGAVHPGMASDQGKPAVRWQPLKGRADPGHSGMNS